MSNKSKSDALVVDAIKRNRKIDMDEFLKAVTDDMIVALKKFEDSGEIPPWNKPWTGTGIYAIMGGKKYPVTSGPCNICSPGKPYFYFLNQYILNYAHFFRGYKTNLWITPDRIKKLGAVLKRDACPMVVCKFTRRSALVFQLLYNIEEIDDYERALGITVVEEELPKNYFKRAAEFGEKLKKQIKFNEVGDSACYIPEKDEVRMPRMQAFIEKAKENSSDEIDAEAYYWSTFFHECIHWTGHKSRLGRFHRHSYRTFNEKIEHYAEEELVAELGSAYLCPYWGIPNKLKHTEYIGSWISILKSGGSGGNHPLMVASENATKAFRYINKLIPREKKKNKRSHF